MPQSRKPRRERWGRFPDAKQSLVGDRCDMCETDPPVMLDAETVDAIAVVRAWGEAFNRRDLERLLALAAADIRLTAGGRTYHGHDAVRRPVHLQSYGIARHVRPRRYVPLAATIAVEAAIELRWVETGELADTIEGVGLFDVRAGRVTSLSPQPDLATAIRVADWPQLRLNASQARGDPSASN